MLPLHVNSKLPIHVSSNLALLFLPSMFLFLKKIKNQAKKKTPKPTAVVLGISQLLPINDVAKGICAPVAPGQGTLKQKGSPWNLNGLNSNVLCNVKGFIYPLVQTAAKSHHWSWGTYPAGPWFDFFILSAYS